MKFVFGDIVVVEGNLIGVVVKCWTSMHQDLDSCDVYVRNFNEIKNYFVKDMERYMVRHKELDEEELEFQRNAIMGL